MNRSPPKHDFAPEVWRAARARFDDVVDADPAERRAAIEAAAVEPAVAEALERLLLAHDAATGFLDDGGVPDSSAASGPRRPGVPQRVGPYEILGVLGEGGFGIVCHAWQRVPIDREVAVKLIKPGYDSPQLLARFTAERDFLSRIEHPDIVKVLDAGVAEDGRMYVVMDLVRGESITAYVGRAQPSIAERLRLMARVCRAVHAVHQRMVIHRDLKPSNVLVADGPGGPCPRIIDFGIATALEEAERAGWTCAGTPIGTLAYASPEQLNNRGGVDTRTDVYSLGVLLCEVLTGQLPRDVAGSLAGTVTPPARLAARGGDPGTAKVLRGDLDRIVLKAVSRDPELRYESAVAFADDIERFLAGKPVRATTPSKVYVARKFLGRHKASATAAGLAAAALAATSIIAVHGQRRAAAEAARAEAVIAFLLEDMVRYTDPSLAFGSGREPTVIDLLRGIEATATTEDSIDARARFDVLSTAAISAEQLRRHDDARRMGAAALAAAAQLEGPSDARVLGLRVLLNRLRQDHRSPEAAAERWAIAAEARERLAPGDPVYAEAELAALSDVPPGDEKLARLGRLAELVAEPGPRRQRVLSEWAACLRSLGRVDQEVEVRREILDLCLRVFTPERSEVLSARHQLVITLATAGRAREALDEVRVILAVPVDAVPPDHPGRQAAERLEVRLLTEIGEHDAAIQRAAEGMASASARFGEVSREHAIACTIHARALHAADRHPEAAEALRRALALRAQIMPALDDERAQLEQLLHDVQR